MKSPRLSIPTEIFKTSQDVLCRGDLYLGKKIEVLNFFPPTSSKVIPVFRSTENFIHFPTVLFTFYLRDREFVDLQISSIFIGFGRTTIPVFVGGGREDLLCSSNVKNGGGLCVFFRGPSF